jgi:phospholipid N-methyltransferase
MIVRTARVAEASVVVEFGPGTGAITEVLLPSLKPGATFMAMEIDPEFVAVLRERFPGVRIHHDSAANTRRYLAEMGLDACDAIVSGLPWSLFSEALQDELLGAAYDVLRPGGILVTYLYIITPATPGGAKFRKRVKERFSNTGASPIVWKNVPPAFVLWAEK